MPAGGTDPLEMEAACARLIAKSGGSNSQSQFQISQVHALTPILIKRLDRKNWSNSGDMSKSFGLHKAVTP